MTVSDQYRDIFNKEIVQQGKGVVFSFEPLKSGYTYQPFRHAFSENSVEDLGILMRKNLFFYAFGEEEIVKYYQNGTFSSMEQAAKYAYKQRLPNRKPTQDGLPSEILLDLLIQMYSPNAHKLAVRTIFRQNDNTEIKGYDLTYFVKDESGISLWLGQAKLGTKSYCKTGINDDLNDKFMPVYLTQQLFFVCDKPVQLLDKAKEILKIIEQINILEMNSDDESRAYKLLKYFSEHHIRIKIPCLLAYDNQAVYDDASSLCSKISNEVDSIKTYFSSHSYHFRGFSPEIVFYIFPIQNIDRLRNKETGFYAGLH